MGIGAALAASYARRGANLVLAARSADLLQQVAAGLPEAGGRVLTVACDVSNPADVERLAAASTSLTGRVEILINNAGVGMNGAVATLDLDAWRQCLEINLLGPVRLIQALLPGMIAAERGTIVQISSVLGKVSIPYTAGYNASKFALNAVSDALRLELDGTGIRVISVYPGSTESNFRSNSLGESKIRKVRPKRKATAEQVAERVVLAVERGERDVYITWRDRLLCAAANRMPGLTDRIVAMLYRRERPE